MDTVSIGIGLVGLGLELYGGLAGAGVAKQQAQVSSQIAGDEGLINEQKRIQMNLDADRSRMEMFRKAQRAGSLAKATATSQNAFFGSGLSGGLGQISGQTGTNVLGVN